MPLTRLAHFDAQIFLSKMGGGGTLAHYRKNRVIFAQGDAADAVFYVQSGQVKLTVVSQRGKAAIVGMFVAGDFFGEGCLADQPLRIATASVITDAALMRIEKAVMVEVLHREPALAALFMTYLLSRNVRFEADLIDQLFNSSEKRLARILLLMAHFGKEGTTEPILVPKVSQETLAEMVGTTRSRVSSFMNKFRKLGFIEYNGGLRVHSSLLNIILHE